MPDNITGEFCYRVVQDVMVIEEYDHSTLDLTKQVTAMVDEIETAMSCRLHMRPVIIRLKHEEDWEILDYRNNFFQFLYGGGNRSIAIALAKNKARKSLLTLN